MQFYVRTSRRTGVSVGALGASAIAFFWLAVIGLPIAAVEWSFRHWYTAPIGVIAIVVAALVVLGHFLQRKP